MAILIPPNGIFANLNPEQLKILSSLAKKIDLNLHEILAQEGESAEQLYYIIEGTIGVFKSVEGGGSHLIAEVGKNNLVGEMALIDNKSRSASLVALEPTHLISFNINELKKYSNIYSILIAHIGIKLSERLRSTDEVTVKSMERALTEERKRIALAIFTKLTLANLALFTLSVSFLKWAHAIFVNTTIMSTILLYVIAIPIFFYIQKSGLPKKTFGLTLQGWRPAVISSVLWSLPVMALIVLGKWLLITYSAKFQADTLFNPTDLFTFDGQMYWKAYFLSLLAYISTCPIQEIIVRGCLQGSLYKLSTGSSANKHFSAILISNLIFAAFHTHTSVIFAMTVFIPGLFWGWLYTKHKSILGVSISHTMIGVWAVFIVGIKEVIVSS